MSMKTEVYVAWHEIADNIVKRIGEDWELPTDAVLRLLTQVPASELMNVVRWGVYGPHLKQALDPGGFRDTGNERIIYITGNGIDVPGPFFPRTDVNKTLAEVEAEHSDSRIDARVVGVHVQISEKTDKVGS